MKNIKIALICTFGGHFEELGNLKKLYTQYDHFWITNRNKQTETELQNERKYFIKMAHFKKPWLYLKHFPTFLKVFYTEKPDCIISTGSGRTALVPFFLSKILRIKFIYIDTFARVNGLSKFGKMLYILNQDVCVQWEQPTLKNTKYIGPIFDDENFAEPTPYRTDMVFVSLGTRPEPYTRILHYVESLIQDGTITEKVIVQAGGTKFNSEIMYIFDFCSPREIDKYIQTAKYVITKESAGLVTKCLRAGTKFIICPTTSDMKEDLHFKLEELGYTLVVNNQESMRKAITNLSTIKSGFRFDNTNAIAQIRTMIEN
jgi:beta-1,4-N-acetylglucosaminyltransferase